MGKGKEAVHMLSERKMRILKSIIDDYILTGIPVGSRSLSKKPDLDFSPATIRKRPGAPSSKDTVSVYRGGNCNRQKNWSGNPLGN